MHVNEGKIRNFPCYREKLEISPVWGKLQIKFPVRTKETEAIVVLLLILLILLLLLLLLLYVLFSYNI